MFFVQKCLSPYLSCLTYNSLISLFTVRCTESPLRILSARLDCREAFNISAGASEERDLVYAPKDAAKFVYQITKVGSQEQVLNCVGNSHPLTFVIGYRMIEKGKVMLDGD